MKTLKTIIAAICFCGLFFTPDENAPLKTYFIWFFVELILVTVCYLIFKSEDKKQA